VSKKPIGYLPVEGDMIDHPRAGRMIFRNGAWEPWIETRDGPFQDTVSG
jgi:hypothetical protein